MNPAGLSHADAEDRVFAPKAMVEHALDQFVGELHLPVNLVDAIEYALMGGGKRLRPVLVFLVARATAQLMGST